MGGDASQMLHIPCTCRVWGGTILPLGGWRSGIYIYTYRHIHINFIHSFHAARVQAERCPAKTACAVYQKREKIEPKAQMKVITETKIRLRHRHIGCLISTKDLKVDCQRQWPDRVSITDMKSKGFATLVGDIFGEGFGQLQHLSVLAFFVRHAPDSTCAAD